MATAIGSLLVNLAMNTAAFASDLGKSTASINSWATGANRAVAAVANSFNLMGKEINHLTEEALSFRGVMLGLVGAGVIGEFVKSNLESATALVHQATAIGISTDTLQEYQFVAKLSGVSTETLNTSLTKFVKNVGDARAGTGSLFTFLQKTNVSLLDQVRSAKSTDEALNDVFNVMGKLSLAADKAALAQASFSRGGVQMALMVRNGTKEFNEQKQAAVDLGIVIDANLLRSAEGAQEKIEVLASILKAKLMTAVLVNADAIAGFVEGLITFGGWIVSITKTVAGWARGFVDSGDKIIALMAVFETFFTVVAVGFVQLGGFVEAFVLGLVAALGHAGNLLEDFGSDMAKMVMHPFNNQGFASLSADLKKGFSGAFRETFDATISDTDAFTKKMADKLQANLAAYGGMIEKIKAQQAAGKPTGFSKGDIDALTSYFKTMKDQADAAAAGAAEADKHFKELAADAKKTIEGIQTPAEKLAVSMGKLNEELAAGLLTQDQYNKAVLQLEENYKRAQDKGTLFTDLMTKAIGGQIHSFKDLGQAVIQYAQQLLIAAATGQGTLGKNLFSTGGGLGNLFSGLGGLFGNGAPAGGVIGPQQPGLLAGVGNFFSKLFHSGGIVGSGGGAHRSVNPAIFAGAKRYHGGGIVNGEVPIIAKKGEMVLTEAQQNSMLGGGGHTYIIDARGAEPGVEARIRGMLEALNSSIEGRAVAAVRDARYRNPNLLRA